MFRRPFVLALACSVTAAAPLAAQITQSEYQQRREALAARAGDAVIVALGAREPAQDYLSFYQNSPFMYLTGFREPDAALVMVRQGGALASTLFVQPKDPAREVWTGNRLGVGGVAAATGLRGRDARSLVEGRAGAAPHHA